MSNTEIKIHNDGKRRCQSWEVGLNVEISDYNGNSSVQITGYGSSKEEAIGELKEMVLDTIETLSSVYYSSVVEVDGAGKPI